MSVIGALIALLIAVILVGLAWWVVNELLPLIPLPEPIRRIVNVILVVILVLIVIYVLLHLLSAIGVSVPVWLGR